ncbi:ArsR/SmtB family transcription factor [Acidobacteriota bacterium]
MEKKEFYKLHAEFCKMISNPKRQEILDVLREKENTVNGLVEKTGFSQSNLSQHLAILRSKGIVQTRRDGTYLYYSITNKKIIEAYDLVSQVLRESLASQNKTIKDALNHKK